MTLLDSLAGISDPATFARDLSDDEAIGIAHALIAEQQLGRFSAIAAAFPIQDDPDTAWPPDYESVLTWREKQRTLLATDPYLSTAAKLYYRDHIAEFVDHWCITYDPRNAGRGKPSKMPFILFRRQRELVDFLLACLAGEQSGLVEKCRDMGATWLACGFSIALWLFWPGSAVGWGSRKEQLVDKLGDPDSIFEKMRMIVRDLPPGLMPAGFSELDHMTYMKFINPENGATITGEAGDNIGRGGRKLIYLKDESAHYERPEKIEAALADNTRVQIDISSVNGLGNVFHRRREAGKDWVAGEELELGRTSVFVMDWRDHPEKDEAWYQTRRQKAIDDGLLHVFEQEVNRNYAASVEGTIIPAEWVKSAIGARERLGIPDRGAWRAALDVADGGGDTNALALFRGIELKVADNWGARDTGQTTRRAVDACDGLGFVDLQYDCVGVGAGVKAEANRLEEEGLLPAQLRLVPWNAGAGVLDPDEPIIPDDRDSPLNQDYYRNFKAQAWLRTARRFEKTHRAIMALNGGEPFTYDPDELISIDPDLPLLRQVEKELSQPTATKHTMTMKMIVNKTPEGTRSPNLADAIIMADNPLPGLRSVYPVAPAEIEQQPFRLPDIWPKAFAMKVDQTKVSVLWGALDRVSDILYITSEHSRSHAEPSANAQAIRARGKWIPGFIETTSTQIDEIRQVIDVYRMLELRVDYSERALEAGIADMLQRVSTGRFKVFSTCTEFLRGYRSYRRAEDGNVIGSGLIDCGRILSRPSSLARMIVKPIVNPFGTRDSMPSRVGDRKIGY